MRNPIPVMAILCCALSAAAQTGNGYEILLKSGSVVPARNINDSLVSGFNEKTARAGGVFVIIQFDRLLTSQEKDALSNAGVSLHDYIPNNAYSATIYAAVAKETLLQYRARSIFELTPTQKMEPRLAVGDFPAWSVPAPGKIDTWISAVPSLSPQVVADRLVADGYEVSSTALIKYRIISLRVNVSQLGELASRNDIEYVQPVPPPEGVLNERTTTLSRGNVMKAPIGFGGRGLSGNGVVVGIGDDGDMQTHIDIHKRLINRSGVNWANHATHVAGTVAGSGLRDELYEGYAPRATIIGQYFSGITINAQTYVNDHGMTIANHSYGFVASDCPFAGLYDLNARVIDQLSLDLPELVHVIAAGNNGAMACTPYSTGFHTVLGGYQSAKNVITTGNTNFAGLLSGASSRGPVKDGRIKPEITSAGVQIPSTWTGNIYSFNTGTSMAAPGVSGGLALLTELYRNENGNANPKAALLKAIITNGASDKENAGPDFKYGFGAMNLIRSSKIIEDATYFNATVAQGGMNTHQVTVPANTAQLKVLLYWHDPPASILASKTLVNDLDLVVESINGTVLPYRLDTTGANLNVAATTGADHLNNIEQVVIDNPPAGTYDLKVSGTAITQNPSQEYFLVFDPIPSALTLTNPIGGERLIESKIVLVAPFFGIDSVYIQWDSYGVNESGFLVEFTPDGVNWTTLNGGNPVNGSLRGFNWGVPQNLTTNQARIRITGSTSGRQVTSQPFVITPTPSVSLPLAQCNGYITIEWPAILNVTDYEVMMLSGETWNTVATTSQLSYTFSGLSKDSTYWVTMRPLVNGTPGRRAYAVSRQPSNGDCVGTISDNDIRVDTILAPFSGRLLTSTALGNNENIALRIKNLDDVACTADITVSYSVNGGPVHQELISPVNIAPLGTLDHTFTLGYDFSAPGTYTIVLTATRTGDPVATNDTYTAVIKQLTNPAITTLDLPWTDDIESAPDQEIRITQMGLNGRDRYDFVSANRIGRLRTFVNSGIAYSGDRALTMDSWVANSGTVDSLTATFNLSTFNTTDDIRVDFRYKNHGQDSAHAANKVWIRGSDTDNWIEIFDLYANQPPNDGSYKLIQSVQINDSLAANGQNFSSSFQMRIGQWGQQMAADNEGGDGYSIDDFRIYRAIDDIQLLGIDTPVVLACGLNSMVPVKVIVLNTSATSKTNVPIVLRVDGIVVANETITDVIPANDTIHYTFNPGTANLQNLGQHLVEVWVDYPTDNVPENDTAKVNATHLRKVNTFPYLENFESGDGTWYTSAESAALWEYGTPASAKINRAASGSKAWKSNIYGYYNNRDSGYLYSPCYDLSSLANPTLSFSIALDLEDCGGGGLCDGAWMDISLDGGATWSRLGDVGQGTNWYNRSYASGPYWSFDAYHRWHVATIPLPTSSNSNVRFRFGYKSDPFVTGDGIAIDDIHIYDNPYGIWTGTGESAPVIQPTVSGNGWVDFIVDNQLIASVNPDGENLGSTEAKAYVNTGGVRINKQQFYHDRNITIKPTNVNLPDSAIVRFYFLDSETEALINATGCASCYKPAMAYDLGVTKYSDPDDSKENGTLADNLMGNYIFINALKATKVPFDKGYYAEFRVKDFSEFWLNNGGFDNNTPLPAELVSFTATRELSDVRLRWTTASEQNVLKFEVEVAKGNDAFGANQFVKIGELPSQGNSATQQHYQMLDVELNKLGIRYYRLRIVDIDGRSAYSPIRPVLFSNEISWHVFPVPSDGRFTFRFQGEPGERIACRLLSPVGMLLKEWDLQANGFAQNVELDLTHPRYAPGVYILQANGRNFSIIKR